MREEGRERTEEGRPRYKRSEGWALLACAPPVCLNKPSISHRQEQVIGMWEEGRVQVRGERGCYGVRSFLQSSPYGWITQ